MKFSKVIRDAVHGYIPITEIEKALIDTPLMQRLRDVKQTGLTYLTYPTALHTRFDHSLGVMHVADKMISALLDRYDSQWKLSSEERDRVRELVRLASLLHDIGHGPFSHVSEPMFRESLERTKTLETGKGGHEYVSQQLIKERMSEQISDPSGKEYLGQNPEILDDVVSVLERKPAIDPKELAEAIVKIINSPIDADKQDYLYRDSYFAGPKYGFIVDADRIAQNLKILEGKLILDMKALSAAETLIISKFEMIRWIYRHHTVCLANELMYRIMLNTVEANILSWEDFTANGIIKKRLTDSYIVHEVSNSVENSEKAQIARGYLRALQNRQLLKPLWTNPDEKKSLIPAHREALVNRAVWEKKEDLEKQFADKIGLSSSDVVIHYSTLEAYIPPYEFPREEEICLQSEGGSPGKLSDLSAIVDTVMHNYNELRMFFLVYLPGSARGDTTEKRMDIAGKLIRAAESVQA